MVLDKFKISVYNEYMKQTKTKKKGWTLVIEKPQDNGLQVGYLLGAVYEGDVRERVLLKKEDMQAWIDDVSKRFGLTEDNRTLIIHT